MCRNPHENDLLISANSSWGCGQWYLLVPNWILAVQILNHLIWSRYLMHCPYSISKPLLLHTTLQHIQYTQTLVVLTDGCCHCWPCYICLWLFWPMYEIVHKFWILLLNPDMILKYQVYVLLLHLPTYRLRIRWPSDMVIIWNMSIAKLLLQ